MITGYRPTVPYYRSLSWFLYQERIDYEFFTHTLLHRTDQKYTCSGRSHVERAREEIVVSFCSLYFQYHIT